MRRCGLKMLVVGLPLMVAGIFLFVLLRDWAVAAFATVVLGRVYVPKPVVFVLGAPMAAGYVLTGR